MCKAKMITNKKYNFLTINRNIPPSNLVCSTNAFACTRIVIMDKIVKPKMIKFTYAGRFCCCCKWNHLNYSQHNLSLHINCTRKCGILPKESWYISLFSYICGLENAQAHLEHTLYYLLQINEAILMVSLVWRYYFSP